MTMKTSIERLGDDRLRLDIEVPDEVVQAAVDEALVAMGRDLRLPGFRPGKVPPQAVLARVGRAAAVEEAVRMHLDDWYRSAVMASGIRPIAAPQIDFPEGLPESTGSGLTVSATIDVAPKPKLPDLSTLEVDRPNLPDTQKYVDQVLEATLRGAGTLVDSDEPAREGDEVVVDFHCTVDDEAVEGAAATGYEARLGDGRLLEELEQAILGEKAGAELQVPVDFEDEHPMRDLAGKHAHFHLKVREVKRVELPELTDDVAGQVSEFDTAEALEADIRGSIEDRLRGEVQGIFRANAVSKLAEVAELDEPAVLVEQRQQEMYMGLKQQLQQSGMTVESYLDRAGRDSESLFAELETSARDDLRRELCLLALAEEAEVQVGDDELKREVSEHAQATGQDPEEQWQRVLASGRADMLRGELLIQRTIDYLVERVKPVPVDLPVADSEAGAAEEGETAGEGGETPADEPVE